MPECFLLAAAGEHPATALSQWQTSLCCNPLCRPVCTLYIQTFRLQSLVPHTEMQHLFLTCRESPRVGFHTETLRAFKLDQIKMLAHYKSIHSLSAFFTSAEREGPSSTSRFQTQFKYHQDLLKKLFCTV